MKIILGLLGGLALVAVALIAWFSREPTTSLVDAAGEALTAGGVPDPAEGEADDTLFAEARALIEERRHEAAKELLLGILESSERDGEACILLSKVTMELGQVAETVDYGLKAVELLPESADAHLAYSRAVGLQLAKETKGFSGILAAMTRINLFREEAFRVIELNPDDVEARTMLTLYFLGPMPVGNIDRAFEMCRELIERDPVAGKQLLALCHKRNDEIELAIEICEQGIEDYPDEPGFHATLADLFVGEERFAEADREFTAARSGEKDDTYYRALYYQARMHVENESDPALALELLEEYIADDPVSSSLPGTAAACWRRGNALEQLGRTEEARASYKESLRRDPEFEQAQESLDSLPD